MFDTEYIDPNKLQKTLNSDQNISVLNDNATVEFQPDETLDMNQTDFMAEEETIIT